MTLAYRNIHAASHFRRDSCVQNSILYVLGQVTLLGLTNDRTCWGRTDRARRDLMTARGVCPSDRQGSRSQTSGGTRDRDNSWLPRLPYRWYMGRPDSHDHPYKPLQYRDIESQIVLNVYTPLTVTPLNEGQVEKATNKVHPSSHSYSSVHFLSIYLINAVSNTSPTRV